MKNRIPSILLVTIMLFLNILHTGCGMGSNQNKTGADSTAGNMAKPGGKFRQPDYLKKFMKVSADWQPPVNNGYVSFGNWSGPTGACINGTGLCVARLGLSTQSGCDSATIGVQFAVAGSGITGTNGLCIVICQPNDTNCWINSTLNRYFMAYGGSNNATGLLSPGMLSYQGGAGIDTAITNALGLPPAVLFPGMPCGVMVDNSSPGQEYWTIFFYGLYPGNSGNMSLSPGPKGVTITSITPYTPNVVNPNPVFFWTYVGSDTTKRCMYMMFNINNLMKSQPKLVQYFPVQNGQLQKFQLTFANQFTFPSDPATVKSTGIPGGTIIPAGSTSPYNMSANNTVIWPPVATQTSDSTCFNGWVTVYIDSIVFPAGSTNVKMNDKAMPKKK